MISPMTGSDMRLSLKSPAGAGIGADDCEKEDAEAKIQNIKHVRPLCAYQRRSPFRARQARNS
jgi:hypothetical protein